MDSRIVFLCKNLFVFETLKLIIICSYIVDALTDPFLLIFKFYIKI